ncbi:MAG: hypothetical protein ACR2G2_16370 [Pseudonocardia sp.]
MSTLRAGTGPIPVPVLFAHLVDDTRLLTPRALAPPMAQVAREYLSARDGEYGGMIGQLVCPVSRLPELVTELARLTPIAPVDISLVVDTGLGAVPKALSLVLSRENLLTPCTVEAAAPNDVDHVWLERVAEFVPEDVLAVVEPRRPLNGDTGQWLDAVRRVADHGCSPKLRCGGTRASDVPSVDQVTAFLVAADTAPAGFTASLGLRHAVRQHDEATGGVEHGLLNMLVAVARARVAGDVRGALTETDGAALVGEVGKLSDTAGRSIRGLLARCGCGSTVQAAFELVSLGAF